MSTTSNNYFPESDHHSWLRRNIPGLFESDTIHVPEDSIPHLEDQFDLPEIDFEVSALQSAPGFECPKLDKNKFSIHPLFLIQQNQIPDKAIQSDASKCKEWLSSKFHIPEDKVEYIANTKFLRKYWGDHLDETLRFYACIWQKPHMLERVKRFMVAREYAHVQAQRRNPRTFLKWNEYIFSRRNVTGREEVGVNLFIIASFLPIPFLSFFYSITPRDIALVVMGAIVVTFFVCKLVFDLINLSDARRQEKEADIHALEITQDIEAAKLFFEALDKSQKESSYTLVRWMFKPIEYIIGNKSVEERFAYIDHASKNIIPNNHTSSSETPPSSTRFNILSNIAKTANRISRYFYP